MLLTKNRFKAYHKFWDGWNSESGSEEFEKRLQENATDNEDSDGEPRVFTKDNSSRHTRLGYRSGGACGGAPRSSSAPQSSVAAASERRRGGRVGAGGAHSQSPDRRRRRSSRSRSTTGRRRGGGRDGADRGSRRGRDRDRRLDDSPAPSPGPAAATATLPRRQSPSVATNSPGSGGTGSGSGRVPSSSPPAADARRAVVPVPQPQNQTQLERCFANASNSSRRRYSRKSLPRGSGSVVNLDEEDDLDESDNKGPVAFLAKKTQLKKEVDAELKKRGLKSYIVPSLQAVVARLDESDKLELKKTGDTEALGKNYDDCMQRLKDLGTQLVDVDQDPYRGP